MSDERMKDSTSQRFTVPVILAVGLHLLVVMLLLVSFSKAPEFEPSQPIVQATLVQLNSESPATTQTDQQIAGEAERTAAQRHEAEELEREQQERQEEQEAAQAAAEQQRQAEAAAARAAEEQKAVEERQQAEQVERQKAEEARRADAARKLAEEEAAKKKAAEEAAQRKAAEEAKRKEDEAKRLAAEEAKRKADAAAKAEADRVAKLKREQEEARASALADLLADETEYQQASADRMGEQVAASYDDVIRRYVSSQWRRPPTARNGMVVEVRISMLPSGDITDAAIVRSSGDAGFDQSAVQAVRNVGRIPEMQQLSREDPATFDRMYRQRNLIFKPEDLDF